MSDSSAPRGAERLLEALGADTDFRDSVIGDLAEEFEIHLQWDGPKAARRWYYRESLRLAPYLLRDWWRNLTWKRVGYFANVVLSSSLAVSVLDFLLRLGVFGLLSLTGTPVDALARSAVFVAMMLVWTLCEGAFAGFVAARIGHRAPLPSAILVALTWMGLMIRSGWHGVPPWFLALNVTMMVAGTIAGGAIPALRSARTD
jgi:hypothetical protein